MRFKLIVALVIMAIGSYSLLWFYMAGKMEDKVLAAISDGRAEGYEISYDKLLVEGFPYRLVVHFPEIDVTLPVRLSKNAPRFYRAENLHIMVQPWRLYHGIVVADHIWAAQGYNASSGFSAKMTDLKSSVIFDKNRHKFLRTSVKISQISWNIDVSRRDEKTSFAHNVNFHIRNLKAEKLLRKKDILDQGRSAATMNSPLVELLFRAEKLEFDGLAPEMFGSVIESLVFEGRLNGELLPRFNRQSLTRWRDTGGTLSFHKLAIETEKLGMALMGDVTLDEGFKPLGALSVEVKGMDHVMSMLSEIDALKEGAGLQIMDELKVDIERKRQKTLKNQEVKAFYNMNVSLQNGLLFFGKIPLIELPAIIQQD
jgi:hypothetical protein